MSTYPTTSYDISGRRVLITGASSGLGAHFARLLHAQGAAVACAARRVDLLGSLVNEFARCGPPAAAVEMDVSKEDSVIAAFDAAEKVIGPIDTVIANAGINCAGLALDLKADDFDRIFKVNVRGAFLTAREAARRMLQQDSQAGGRIILIASIGGLTPLPGLAAYSASKAAIVMLGQSLAREWINKNINVNVVCPGFMRTELNGEWFDSGGGLKQIAKFPRQRLMNMADMDPLISFLASTSSRGITGSTFKVDDGQTL